MTKSKVVQRIMDELEGTLMGEILDAAIANSHNTTAAHSSVAYLSFSAGAKWIVERLRHLQKERIAEVGELILFGFDDNIAIAECYRGKSFVGKVNVVDIEGGFYDVWTDYGQDIVSFDDAKLLANDIVFNKKLKK